MLCIWSGFSLGFIFDLFVLSLGVDIVTNSYPQPGRICKGENVRWGLILYTGRYSGKNPSSISCQTIRNASIRDGLIYRGIHFPNDQPKLGHYLALFIWPNVDYHWIRKVRLSLFLLIKFSSSIRIKMDIGHINLEVWINIEHLFIEIRFCSWTCDQSWQYRFADIQSGEIEFITMDFVLWIFYRTTIESSYLLISLLFSIKFVQLSFPLLIDQIDSINRAQSDFMLALYLRLMFLSKRISSRINWSHQENFDEYSYGHSTFFDNSRPLLTHCRRNLMSTSSSCKHIFLVQIWSMHSKNTNW